MRKLTVMMIVIVSTTLLALTGCGKSDSAAGTAAKYTCPMHPEVVQDKPGNCPKCQMKLVEKKA